MKLLFLAPQAPYPPNKGTAIRNFNIIRHLAANHEIHLVCFGDKLSADQRSAINKCCVSVQTVQPPGRSFRQRLRDTALSTRPDLALRLASPAFTRLVAATLRSQRIDIVQVEGLEMATHWLALELDSKERPLVVLDEHNAEYVLQRRTFLSDAVQPARWVGAAYSAAQWLKLRAYEGRACRKADGVVAVSEPDARALGPLAPRRPLAVVPNGVDTHELRPLSPPTAPHLLFTGTMDFRPNVDAVCWFVRQVFPLVRRALPDARFYIVGQRPNHAVLSLGEQPGVVVTGAVDDLLPYWERAAICVVPIRMGGGVRLKVLEAMALGRPIVSTALGCDGIEAQPGRHFVQADSPAHFARAIVELLGDSTRCRALVRESRHLVERRYDWRQIVPMLDEFYRKIAASG